MYYDKNMTTMYRDYTILMTYIVSFENYKKELRRASDMVITLKNIVYDYLQVLLLELDFIGLR